MPRATKKIAGLPDVCRNIKRANDVFAELGIQTTASITASRLIEDYEKLPAFLTELGFKSCTFSYPLTTLGSSYLSYSNSAAWSITRPRNSSRFSTASRPLQSHSSGYPVINPTESISEMQRHLRGEPEKFPCLAGYKYFYLDWNLNSTGVTFGKRRCAAFTNLTKANGFATAAPAA